MANEVETKEEVSIGELSSQEFKEARKNGLETVPKPEPKAEEHEEKEEKPKEKGGFQARIARLIKQSAAKDEYIAKLESRQKEAPKTEEKQIAAQSNGEPQEADFADKGQYFNALYDWRRNQEKQAEAQAAATAEQEEKNRVYFQKLAAARAEYEDFDEIANQDIKIPLKVEEVIREEIDNPGQLIRFLGSNPELCEELMKMKPGKAVAEVWNISEKLASTADEEETEEEEKSAAKAKVEEKPARKAPEPIRPVGNGRSRGTIPLHQQDMKDFKKNRAAGRIE
jgi:hypothetical protein